MKTIARIELQPGMELAEDIVNSNGDLIAAARTKVDSSIISRLARLDIMVVSIMEEIDYATTHFERVRLSNGFKKFVDSYQNLYPYFKSMMNALVENGTPIDTKALLEMYHVLTDDITFNRTLLDYLYNMVVDEDELTYTHCLNSALIAGAFANWLGMKEEEKNTLILCGYLYDIGKLKLPNDLLWKPGKLTDVEFARIKTHPILGYNIVKDHTNLNPAIFKSILMHHERCDGQGYPSRLKMEQIDQYARHISVIDAYEAMTSPRSYRPTLMPLQVIERFEASGMMQYDYTILHPIMTRIADSQIGMTVKLSDNSMWEIFLINQLHMSRPILRKDVAEDKIELLDLMERTDLQIVAIY
ncbi:MAG: HD domain-containing protein [Lachnospiraceae bacterium]|nr:HD domain-containing protein [Lachnospiraceae bacterium]